MHKHNLILCSTTCVQGYMAHASSDKTTGSLQQQLLQTGTSPTHMHQQQTASHAVAKDWVCQCHGYHHKDRQKEGGQEKGGKEAILTSTKALLAKQH